MGSKIEVREDPKSLPVGYEPLTREANGVPYANPVSLDSAVAGAAVLFVNVPSSVATELAQDTPAGEGEPTDLAVVALQCADAPATDALTSFFSSGTPPGGCEPAAGVDIAVTENEKPLSASPFRTDTSGTLAVQVGLGSKVTVKEDPKSLPSGYEPLTQKVNGVPYANPVELDSAVAGAAVLFVNVPNSVAARLAGGTSAVDASGATGLAHAVRLDRTGCDPAYPDQRTCIAPGSPLAEPCSITDQRNFTVLRPDPRGLDTDGDGIGCEPISPSGGAINHGAGFNLYSSGVLRRAAPARTGDFSVAASRVDTGNGVWVLPPEGSHADNWFMHRGRNGAGPWFTANDRISSGNLAVVSNPVFIGNGLWTWPNRHGQNDWFWQRRNHDGFWFWPSQILVGNISVANSGSGNVAIVSNPVVISNGVWAWPGRTHADGSIWQNHNHADDRHWPDNVAKGSWFWPGNGTRAGNGGIAVCNANGGVISLGDVNSGGNRGNTIVVGNTFGSVNIDGGTVFNRTSIDLAANGGFCRANASGGIGDVAIASNPIVIGSGVRTWPGHTRLGNDDWRWPNHTGDSLWFQPNGISVGNLTVANSGNGNVAIASNPVFIGNGLWRWPGHTRDDGWFWQSRNRDGISFRPNVVSVGNLTIAGSGNGNIAIASNPVFISSGVWAWPNQASHNDWFWQSRNLDDRFWPDRNRFGNGIWGWPSTISLGNLTVAGSGNGNIAIASNPVFISSGVWHWPGPINNGFWLGPNRGNNSDWRWPNHFGSGVWGWPRTISVGNLVVARSGSGNIAIVSNPIVISSGVWFVAPDRNHDDHWLMRGDGNHADNQLSHDGAARADGADGADVEPLAINGGGASEPPSKAEQLGTSELQTLTVNGELAVGPPPADTTQAPSDSSVQPPTELVQSPSDSNVALPSEDNVETPVDGYVASEPASAVQPPADTGAPDPGYVAPDASSVDPSYVDAGTVDSGTVDSGYVAPDPGTDPGYSAPDPSYVAPEPSYVDPGVDPSYVAPEPSYVDPGYVEPSYVDPGNVDPGYVAPDPGIEPSYSEPQSSYVDPGIDAGYVAPEPSYAAPEPNYVDAGNAAANPGIDTSYSGPDPSNLAPEPNYVEPSYVDAGNIAPDPGMDVAGNAEAGNVASNPDSGHGKRDRGGHNG